MCSSKFSGLLKIPRTSLSAFKHHDIICKRSSILICIPVELVKLPRLLLFFLAIGTGKTAEALLKHQSEITERISVLIRLPVEFKNPPRLLLFFLAPFFIVGKIRNSRAKTAKGNRPSHSKGRRRRLRGTASSLAIRLPCPSSRKIV